MGLRLADSAVDVENVEISGASTAGLEIAGADRSVVRFSYIHDNPGAGVIVRDQAAPQLHQNFIFRNGTEPAAQGPGIEIRGAAQPQLIQNRIEGNGAAAVWIPEDKPTGDRANEIFGFNAFGTLPRDKAVRVQQREGQAPPTKPSSPPAPAPAGKPRRRP
jgi:hypothetical protein